MQLQVSGLHQEKMYSLLVTPKHTIIFRFPWMQLHNLKTSWPNWDITQWSHYCFQHCLHHPHNTLVSTTIESPDSPSQVLIPKEYHKFMEVFSKAKESGLPSCPYDCMIDLLPSTTPTCNRIYPLSLIEQQVMEEYVQQGYILPPTSPASVGLFLWKKEGRNLSLHWLQRSKPNHREVSLSAAVSPIGTWTALCRQDFHPDLTYAMLVIWCT